MTAPAPTAPELSDNQLRTVAAYIARICLEVERGLRPPDQLTSLAHPRTTGPWRQIQTGRFRGGPVVRHDIGPPQLSRLAHDHAIATVVTRTQGDRWGALTVRLRAERGRWYIADLKRLLAAANYRNGPDRTLPPDLPLDEKTRRITDQRQLVHAALNATTRRLDGLDKTDPGRAETRRQAQRWQRIANALDHELVRSRTREGTTVLHHSRHR